MDDEIPYRSAIPDGIYGGDAPATADEHEFSTLVAVLKILDEAIDSLRFDIVALDLPDGLTVDQSLSSLLIQVKGKQEAYRILAAVYQSVKAAVEKVNLINSLKSK